MADEDDILGPIVEIKDPADPRISDYRNLKDARGRAAQESRDATFVVEGKFAVRALVQSPYAVRSLLVDDHQVNNAADIVTAIRELGAPVYVASRAALAQTVGFDLHRGVVAIGYRKNVPDGLPLVEAMLEHYEKPTRAIFMVLEGLSDHENIGALFRNAAAFGVTGVLLDPTCADPLYRRSVRVSLGHVLSVPFGRLGSWPDALVGMRHHGIEVIALTPHRGDLERKPIDLAEFAARRTSRPLAIVVGTEGHGLSHGALGVVDELVNIPMELGVDSLNVATATAIALYSLKPGRI